MPTHSKQHFIPRGYLTAWCDPKTPRGHDPYVWMHPAGEGAPKRKAPKGIFTETDIYTVQGPNGRDLGLEHALSRLESMFARIMRTVIEPKKPLGMEDRVALCAFIAALHARTPSQRDHLKSEWTRIAKWSEGMAAQYAKMSPEQLKVLSAEPVGSKGFSIEDVQMLADNPMPTFLPATMMSWTPVFARMNLTILCAEGPGAFITSDAPVAVLDREAKKRGFPFDAPSVMSPTVEISLPLSPRRAAVLSYLRTPLYMPVRNSFVREQNQTTVAFARDWYVSNTEQREPGLIFNKRTSAPADQD